MYSLFTEEETREWYEVSGVSDEPWESLNERVKALISIEAFVHQSEALTKCFEGAPGLDAYAAFDLNGFDISPDNIHLREMDEPDYDDALAILQITRGTIISTLVEADDVVVRKIAYDRENHEVEIHFEPALDDSEEGYPTASWEDYRQADSFEDKMQALVGVMTSTVDGEVTPKSINNRIEAYCYRDMNHKRTLPEVLALLSDAVSHDDYNGSFYDGPARRYLNHSYQNSECIDTFENAIYFLSSAAIEYILKCEHPAAHSPIGEVEVKFTPQKWVKDNAVRSGEDITFEVPFTDVLDDSGHLIYNHSRETDELKEHPDAPEEVKNHEGPFFITFEIQ